MLAVVIMSILMGVLLTGSALLVMFIQAAILDDPYRIRAEPDRNTHRSLTVSCSLLDSVSTITNAAV
jgi:hypothetical protein